MLLFLRETKRSDSERLTSLPTPTAHEGVSWILSRSDSGQWPTGVASDRDETRVVVKGKGAKLPDLTLPLELPLTVRLVNNDTGVCWEATFDEEDVISNSAASFKAKK